MKKIYFRADASSDIGYGHFVRSLALADMLKDDFDCCFATIHPTEYQLNEMSKVCQYLPIPDDDSHYDYFLSLLTGDEIVVLDNYFFTIEYQRKIRNKGCRLVCIDDRPGLSFNADVVINHVIGTNRESFQSIRDASLLLGPAYALLRNGFRQAMCSPKMYNSYSQDVLIAMGGTDYFDMTGKITDILLNNTSYKINLLIGDSYKYIDRLQGLPVKVLKNLSDYQLVELISKQKFIITPPSTLAYEVCAVGCPLIVGSFADNHFAVEKALSDSGLSVSCGKLKDLTSESLLNTVSNALKSSSEMLKKQKEIFDGKQQKNLIEQFRNLI